MDLAGPIIRATVLPLGISGTFNVFAVLYWTGQGAIHNAGCSWFQIAENTIAKIHFTGCGYGAVSAVCGRWLANPGVHSLQRPKGQVYEHLHSVGASTSPALVGMGSRVHHVVQAVFVIDIRHSRSGQRVQGGLYTAGVLSTTA